MVRKIYIVTSGAYSDYGIDAVFSRRELAEEFSGLKEDSVVEEWDIDHPKKGWSLTVVRMGKRGGVKDIWHEVLSRFYLPGFQTFDVNSNLVWAVGTQDEKRAVKVVNEKRAQILAQGFWRDGIKVGQLFGGANAE
ncbi:hypothetical protein LCGC14_3010720 [marine sediment metagenome]|uniref:Uncharacterized protein n=1 Tax=marine sediment metagenome TaxID=412755 RepID=A0A0F8WYP8_9ZZZZ